MIIFCISVNISDPSHITHSHFILVNLEKKKKNHHRSFEVVLTQILTFDRYWDFKQGSRSHQGLLNYSIHPLNSTTAKELHWGQIRWKPPDITAFAPFKNIYFNWNTHASYLNVGHALTGCGFFQLCTVGIPQQQKKKNCNKAGELQMLSGYNKGSCHAKHAQ